MDHPSSRKFFSGNEPGPSSGHMMLMNLKMNQRQACMHEMLMNLKMYLEWLGHLMSLRTAIHDLQMIWAPHPLILLKRHAGIAAEKQSMLLFYC